MTIRKSLRRIVRDFFFVPLPVFCAICREEITGRETPVYSSRFGGQVHDYCIPPAIRAFDADDLVLGNTSSRLLLKAAEDLVRSLEVA